MRVRGTMQSVPEIEVNIDTVYIRSNIERIEEEDFEGWEYDEEQYDKDDFIELISKENKELKQNLKEEQQTSRINMLGLIEVNNRLRELEG